MHSGHQRAPRATPFFTHILKSVEINKLGNPPDFFESDGGDGGTGGTGDDSDGSGGGGDNIDGGDGEIGDDRRVGCGDPGSGHECGRK